MTDRNVEAVREQLSTRAEHGLHKYGVTTERADLSPLQWIQHLQDELMDGAVYAERLKQELGKAEIIPALNAALDLLSEARTNTHHSFQKTHVAIREATKEVHRALILAGG